MKRKLLIILAVLLALACLGSTAAVLYMQRMERESEESTAYAHQLVELPDEKLLEETPEPVENAENTETEPGEQEETLPEALPLRDRYANALANMDLGALREVNTDVIGWIEIPDTRVSYPLLQCDNNSYYLSRSWQKWDNPAGSIFMEYQNAPDFSDFNTLIYGHRMGGGDMFGELHLFGDAEYMNEHPRIYVVTDSGCRVYEVFAACEVPVDSRVYAMNFSNDSYKQAYINHCFEISAVESGVEVEPEDSIITLSTCTRFSGKGYRFIVQGVYIGTAPRDSAQQQISH